MQSMLRLQQSREFVGRMGLFLAIAFLFIISVCIALTTQSIVSCSVRILKMAKGSRGRHRIASRQYRLTPYPLAPCKRGICEDVCQKKCFKAVDKKEWEDVTCSVCMEYPHNAVLLLCSSHDKGCRPYMCGTSFRHSNCLDQYKKAYTKVISSQNGLPMQGSIDNPGVTHDSNSPLGKNEVTELACPLCRGQVKGWTVVEPVRDYLNAKKRSCMQENCSFVGSYKELQKHVKAEHPLAHPRMVDPDHEQKWRWLEWEREREDVISTVTSTMPGAVVFGDYVIEGHHNDFDTDEEEFDAGNAERNGRFQMGIEAMNFFLLLHAVRQGNDVTNISRRLRPELAPNMLAGQNGAGELDASDEDNDDGSYNEGNDDGVSLVSRLQRHGGGRVLLGRSGRRRRRREAHARMGDS